MCTDYKEKECKTTKRFPFTCHTCTKKSHCNLPKYYYDPNVAQKDYDNTLVETLVDFTNKDAKTMIRDENEWCIVVTERITWENGEYTRIPRLYIYVPVAGKDYQFQ